MLDGINLIREGIKKIEEELEKTVYAAAKEVRELGTASASEYADAILYKNRNMYGRDISEIYLYKFAPEGYPRPDNNINKYWELLKNPKRKKEYNKLCYNGWYEEIKKVQEVIDKYSGSIFICEDNYLMFEGGHSSYMTLQDYWTAVQSNEISDFIVHVRIHTPELAQLRLKLEVEESITRLL